MSRGSMELAPQESVSFSETNMHSENMSDLGQSLLSSRSSDPDQARIAIQQSETGLWDGDAELLEVTVTAESTETTGADEDTEGAAGTEPGEAQEAQVLETEECPILPFDRRPSYLRITRRLQRIRVLPALAACSFALLVTAAVCATELTVGVADNSSTVALLTCSTLACILAAVAARVKSHVLLVGLVLLEVLFTLYTIAFGAVGLVNVKLLKQRQASVQGDGSLQAEQRDNALKIIRRMLIEQAIFSGLYFFVAAAHFYAAASANHLRAAVWPFDSRLRRKRQRARAINRLGVSYGPDLVCQGLPLHAQEAEVAAGTEQNFADDLRGTVASQAPHEQESEGQRGQSRQPHDPAGLDGTTSRTSSGRSRRSSSIMDPPQMMDDSSDERERSNSSLT